MKIEQIYETWRRVLLTLLVLIVSLIPGVIGYVLYLWCNPTTGLEKILVLVVILLPLGTTTILFLVVAILMIEGFWEK